MISFGTRPSARSSWRLKNEARSGKAVTKDEQGAGPASHSFPSASVCVSTGWSWEWGQVVDAKCFLRLCGAPNLSSLPSRPQGPSGSWIISPEEGPGSQGLVNSEYTGTVLGGRTHVSIFARKIGSMSHRSCVILSGSG